MGGIPLDQPPWGLGFIVSDFSTRVNNVPSPFLKGSLGEERLGSHWTPLQEKIGGVGGDLEGETSPPLTDSPGMSENRSAGAAPQAPGGGRPAREGVEEAPLRHHRSRPLSFDGAVGDGQQPSSGAASGHPFERKERHAPVAGRQSSAGPPAGLRAMLAEAGRAAAAKAWSTSSSCRVSEEGGGALASTCERLPPQTPSSGGGWDSSQSVEKVVDRVLRMLIDDVQLWHLNA